MYSAKDETLKLQNQLERCSELQLCAVCLSQYLGRDDSIASLPNKTVLERNLAAIALSLPIEDSPNSERTNNPIYASILDSLSREVSERDFFLCCSCFGALSNDVAFEVAEKVLVSVDALQGRTHPVCIEIHTPPVINTMRITARSVITQDCDKQMPFPPVEVLMQNAVMRLLDSNINFVQDEGHAVIKVVVEANIGNQLEYCQAIWPAFKEKRAKRKFGTQVQTNQSIVNVNEEDATAEANPEATANIAQKSVDTILTHWKALEGNDFHPVGKKLLEYVTTLRSKIRATFNNSVSNNTTTTTTTTTNNNSSSSSSSSSGNDSNCKNDNNNDRCSNEHISGCMHPRPAMDSSSLLPAPAIDKEVMEDRNRNCYKATWRTSAHTCPQFFLGRYRKFARDVPQSPWTITTNTTSAVDTSSSATATLPDTATVAAAEKDSSNDELVKQEQQQEQQQEQLPVQLQSVRKGRASVEEIVNEAVQQFLQAKACRMHPCGREDINVRCLGNGRPFALEVVEPGVKVVPDELLSQITDYINSGEGMNKEKDVELVLLRKADKRLWESMQYKAEEKRKGYSCMVWTAKPVTRQMLEQLLDFASRSGEAGSDDETGEPCFKLQQRTPLRVLHRRSLLDRVRYVYEIETALINPHFFVMRLVTSAGTYVKEFVHGDLGRTSPSVSSLLQCPCDLLQLDVTRLYDDLEGGDSCTMASSGVTHVAPCPSLSTATATATNSLTWSQLKTMRLATLTDFGTS